MAKEALRLHEKLRGKLEISPKIVPSPKNLHLIYTPGVAEASRAIADSHEEVYNLTIKGNSVAVVTDGSAALGMGNLGPEAALPVMEGKCIIFKKFADIDAFPICLATQEVDEIVETIRRISPVFGGINLEDIEAPRCFEIERKLQDLGIPVFHDDQHGTAITVYAALLNASKVVKKDFEDLRVVISGAGAAGTAIAKLLTGNTMESYGYAKIKNLTVVDSKGAIYSGRSDLVDHKKELARFTNKERSQGGLGDMLKGADAFVGVSRPGIVTSDMVRSMSKDPIILSIANPVPEIMPSEAKKGGAKVIATGRSDFPNQVNNALVFPGIFRGALNARVKRITTEMKVNAALALAGTVKPTANKIVPSIFDRRIVKNISRAIEKTARR